ncbi:hypothetical protein GCM10010124_38590 [Pilimelia terevasa]|uniref:Uncharacterized protein n=1 Tax=Pilimelia terevasa TaxID=53372 RepID=A0A8J3BRX3_9ACTN|nr:hypothetical protein [Pilimelia terevasa]GGK42076.1 hypothetical protein GCM10010124_38590 [Pilimelia terevasa]
MENDTRPSRSDVARTRAEWRDGWPAVLLLVVLAVITETGLFGADGDAAFAWSLAHLVPAGWIVVAQVRGLRRADEYQRRSQLEALAVGFAAVMSALYVIGLLQSADIGNLRQQVQITWIGGVLVWLAVRWLKTHRAA